MAYVAPVWEISGNDFIVARIAGWLIAASALFAVFQLSRRFATVSVAIATVICTALFPVFFARISTAPFDMTAASLTLWGLLLYLPRRTDDSSHGTSPRDTSTNKTLVMLCLAPVPTARVFAATILFALAALIKGTAILTPLALVAWSFACRAFDFSPNRRHARSSSPTLVSLIPMLAALPLMMWFAYHFARNGYVSGNDGFFQQTFPATFDPARIFRDAAQRLWYVTADMNLWTLSLPALIVMLRPAIIDDGIARPRINVNVQLAFLAVILAHVVALSVIKNQTSASDMLSVYPLAVLIYVSTLRRRFRFWLIVVAVACLAFIARYFAA